MHYSYLGNPHQRRVRARLLKLLSGLLVIGLFIVAYIFFDSRRQNADQPQPLTQKTHTVQARLATVMNSSSFQFQAPKDWVEVPNETTTSRFVYRRYNGHLIEKELRIYVDTPIDQVKAARVLPVTIQGQKLVATAVSEPCRQAPWFTNHALMPDTVSWQKVRFLCDAESSDYSVIIGQIGGSSVLPIQRATGAVGYYSMLYRDLSADQKPDDVQNIIQSFQAH